MWALVSETNAAGRQQVQKHAQMIDGRLWLDTSETGSEAHTCKLFSEGTHT